MLSRIIGIIGPFPDDMLFEGRHAHEAPTSASATVSKGTNGGFSSGPGHGIMRSKISVNTMGHHQAARHFERELRQPSRSRSASPLDRSASAGNNAVNLNGTTGGVVSLHEMQRYGDQSRLLNFQAQ